MGQVVVVSSTDFIRGQSFTTAEKWESDERKKQALRALVYFVITIWESDDLESKRHELEQYLSHSISLERI